MLNDKFTKMQSTFRCFGICLSVLIFFFCTVI